MIFRKEEVEVQKEVYDDGTVIISSEDISASEDYFVKKLRRYIHAHCMIHINYFIVQVRKQ